MSEMIERVAKALEKVELGNNWEAMARAAIEAMREPTDEIGRIATRSIDYSSGDIWKMMINVALK